MSNSLVWQQPRAQPARLEPGRSLIGQVQSCVTDRKPADWGRRYLRIVALIKALRRRFVNSRRSGSPHQCPGPAGLNYSSAALVWFTASSRCLELGTRVAGSSSHTLSPAPSLPFLFRLILPFSASPSSRHPNPPNRLFVSPFLPPHLVYFIYTSPCLCTSHQFFCSSSLTSSIPLCPALTPFLTPYVLLSFLPSLQLPSPSPLHSSRYPPLLKCPPDLSQHPFTFPT